MHETDDSKDDRRIAHLLGERPEPRRELRSQILEKCRREQAAVLSRRRRRERIVWLSLAACALVLSLIDIGASRYHSRQVAFLLEKIPSKVSPTAVAAFRTRSAELVALLLESDPASGEPAGLHGPTIPIPPALP